MRETESNNDNVDPVCTSADGLSASPSPRIVQAVQAFGPNGVVASVCSEDFRPILAEILRPIGEGVTTCAGYCLERGHALRKQRDGTVNCVLRETLPKDGPIARCEQLADFVVSPNLSILIR